MSKTKPNTPIDDTFKRMPMAAVALLSVLLNKNIEFGNVVHLPNEFSEILKRFTDLLFRITIPKGKYKYTHIEYQSSKDKDMHVRMIIYACLVFLYYRAWPKQYVINLYKVNNKKHFIEKVFRADYIKFWYTEINIYFLNANDYFNHENLELAILAVLMKIPEGKEKIILQQIINRIVNTKGLTDKQKYDYINSVDYFCGLRSELQNTLSNIVNNMSVIVDIKKTVLYGKGHEDGVAEGKEAGIAEGIAEGEKRGEILGQLKTAKELWKKGASLDFIKDVVNLPEKDWQDFLKSIGQE